MTTMVSSLVAQDTDFCSGFRTTNIGTGENKAKRIAPGYTAWVNLLDYSAAVLPVMLADKTIDVVDKGYKPLNAQDEKCFLGCKISFFVSKYI
jgi:hypothetical protein